MEVATKNSIFASVVGLIGIAIIIYFFKESDKTLPNYITVIGTICSLIGLALSYINIIALKNTNIEMRNKIEKTLTQVSNINTLSDINKTIKANHEIQQYIRASKIEIALLRMQDLKYLLLQFSYNENLDKLTNDQIFQDLVVGLGIDLNSISDHLINNKRKLDFSRVNNNLEALSTHLTKFESTIKKINYDTA